MDSRPDELVARLVRVLRGLPDFDLAGLYGVALGMASGRRARRRWWSMLREPLWLGEEVLGGE